MRAATLAASPLATGVRLAANGLGARSPPRQRRWQRLGAGARCNGASRHPDRHLGAARHRRAARRRSGSAAASDPAARVLASPPWHPARSPPCSRATRPATASTRPWPAPSPGRRAAGTRARARSVGAIGVMQLMPATARWFGRDVVGRRVDPHHLTDNIEGGVAYLAWLAPHHQRPAHGHRRLLPGPRVAAAHRPLRRHDGLRGQRARPSWAGCRGAACPRERRAAELAVELVALGRALTLAHPEEVAQVHGADARRRWPPITTARPGPSAVATAHRDERRGPGPPGCAAWCDCAPRSARRRRPPGGGAARSQRES